MREGGGRPLPDGWRLIFRDVVDSTNDAAMALAREGACEGTVVWARRQTRGRGRQGRSWVSDAGNLYCSTIVRPICIPAVAATIGFVAALAAAETVAALPIRGDVRIKWPNDILIDGAKVAGILIEADMDASGTVIAMVIGIGINVANAPRSAETRYPATSLDQVAKEPGVDPETVLGHLCAALDERMALWRRDGFGPVRDRWLAMAFRLGETITVGTDGGVLRGRFEGLADDGALMLRDGNDLKRISAGDVLLPERG